jgi:endoglucanase
MEVLMQRRRFLSAYGGFLVAGGLFSWLSGAGSDEKSRPRRGVSLAGPEFATQMANFSNENPGTFGRDYTYNSEATVAYFCTQGLRLLRLPLRWERLQPRLSQSLDAAELSRVETTVAWAQKHGGRVILDIHNYGRYFLQHDGQPCSCVIDQPLDGRIVVSRRHFADLWRRLAQAFRSESAVYAYGLMNEPHDMGQSSWQAISQAAVDAIRRGKDSHLILVAGDGWSSAAQFAQVNGRQAWIDDIARNTAYEAHCYFDEDSSGHYARSFEVELARDSRLVERGVHRLRPFVHWCRANRVRGFIGEYGIPASETRWHAVLSRFLEELDQAGMDSCYWAAGEWWGQYPLSIQPDPASHQPAALLRLLTK